MNTAYNKLADAYDRLMVDFEDAQDQLEEQKDAATAFLSLLEDIEADTPHQHVRTEIQSVLRTYPNAGWK